ncbi:MAG: cytochrome c [Chloroflexi bacterium]|nr:cytochrome c [Chloroflexota bacterium]
MILRATGVKEVLIILASMVIGAVFIVFAFQFGTAARPEEMRVWGSTEAAAVSTPSSSSKAGSSASSSPSSAVPVAATTAPASTGASSTGSATAGKAVFDRNCTSCHPGGNKGVGPALNTADFKQRSPQDSDVETVIRKGKGALMPAFSTGQVSDSDLKNLVAYIRSLN